ncbi:UDP-4-amino-4,6-dideoxy-N-acetyl-beta-L-altrosamine transaminase [Melioribacter sp. OK-6-Me]|uniref:UDP-4-amino-4, 6-dideoxy-N-acetyl-beta-L-altrosamine transaminase n=1 Tax=unclassified Melioribacter TaxID=2627329 RepID=UPI003EDAA60B
MNSKTYSYGKQNISKDDIECVVKVLQSDWLTQGPTIDEFEKALTDKFGAIYAAACSNGTAGLHLIALGLGWSKGDVVITTPITFLASANCAIYAGADVDFADIDPLYYTIDPNKLEDKIKSYRKKNINVKAVVAVDYAGQPSNWEALKSLKDKYEFQLVNDFCHAPGAEYKKDYTYAVKYADAVNLSFHPVKHITTGEGGAVLSNDSSFIKRVKTLRTHGATKDPTVLEKNDGPWYYEMHEVGFNYRITDFQCALGISQLKKLDSFVVERRKIAKYYDAFFKNDDRFIIPHVNKDSNHAYHLYPLQIKFDELKISKKSFFEKMREKKIFLQVHYIPVHLQPFYKKRFGFKEGDYPEAELFYKREISIPIYPGLNEEDLNYITKSIASTLDLMK